MKAIGSTMKATQIKCNKNFEQETPKYFILLRENILEAITYFFFQLKILIKLKNLFLLLILL